MRFPSHADLWNSYEEIKNKKNILNLHYKLTQCEQKCQERASSDTLDGGNEH